MSTPAHDLALHLQAEGFGTFATDLFVGSEPASPDNVTTLYDTGGAAPVLFDENLRNPTIQVRVRDNDYTQAYSLQQSVFDIFNAIEQETVQGTHYVGVWLSSDIISLGRDENGRFLLTANYEIQRGYS